MLRFAIAVLFVLCGLAIQGQCDSFTTLEFPFNSTSLESNLNTSVSFIVPAGPQAVAYTIFYNVSSTTSLSVMDITVTEGAKVIDYGVGLVSSSTNLTLVGALGGIVDPCNGTVSENQEVSLNYVAETNGISGILQVLIGTADVLKIENNTAFTFVCPLPSFSLYNSGLCSRFYTLDATVAEGDTSYLIVSSTAGVQLKIASGQNCPTVVHNATDSFYNQTLTAGQELVVLSATANTTFWVQVIATTTTAPSLTFTWSPTGVIPPPVAPNTEAPVAESPVSVAPESVTPVTEPATGPSAESPVAAPVATPAESTALPTWAEALLVVFGIVIAILLVVVIVMCVKAKRRANYTAV